MDVLLIVDDAGRRVAVADHLAKSGHRITLSSSIREGREILQFAVCETEGPDAVIISEGLLARDGQAFREELGDRFPSANWIPLPHDRSVVWLSEWLERVRGMPCRRRSRPPEPRFDILLIEADDTRRQATSSYLSRCGDRVKACRSIAEATEALAAPAWQANGPHAIVSRVDLADGCGINFFFAAKKRFPRTRWVVTSAVPCEVRRMPRRKSLPHNPASEGA